MAPIFILLALAGTSASLNPFELSGKAWRKNGDLAVTVEIHNVSGSFIGPLAVEADLMGRVETAGIDAGLEPEEKRTLEFRFPFDPPRPGVYPLVLLFEHDQDEAPISRRGCLLLSLGAHAPPALDVKVSDFAIGWRSRATARISSADGQAHRATLRALTGRGLVVSEETPKVVDVPAAGVVDVPIHVLYAGAPRATRQGLLVLASPQDGSIERASVATSVVFIRAVDPLLPRLRWPLAGIGFALLAAAFAIELNLFRRR